MLIGFVLIPAIVALLCLALPGSMTRRLALVAGAAVHFALVVCSWLDPISLVAGDILGLDALGHLLITLISLLFLATAIYFVGYHRKALLSQRVFLACMLALLAALSLACVSQHLGLLWVALEASSLAATPLIYFRLGARSLEATWKFLLMNSVGIALALLGTFCVALATSQAGENASLTLSTLLGHAALLDPRWLRAGFLLTLVGYGTKMGLAPMHSWKPDAYGEAPPPIAAFLAGGMTLAAFLGILRIFQLCVAQGLATDHEMERFAGFWMTAFGLLSIATAAVFIIGNRDYRRLLAYTSVEHMGVLVLGMGLGVSSSYGAYSSLLHAMHNTLNKGVLFFAAGIIWRIYGTNRIDQVHGTIHRNRLAAILLLLGLCATSGIPPFGMFFSELGILMAAAQSSSWWVAGTFALTLAVVFVGAWTALLPMAFGESSPAPTHADNADARWRQWVMAGPAVCLLLLALGLGAYQPACVRSALEEAAHAVFPQQAAIATTVRMAHSSSPAVSGAVPPVGSANEPGLQASHTQTALPPLVCGPSAPRTLMVRKTADNDLSRCHGLSDGLADPTQTAVLGAVCQTSGASR